MLDKINKIARTNGFHTVTAKAQEELYELIAAIGEGDREHISEEIADCLIMMYQLIKVYDNESEVYDMIDFKIKRTFERLGIKE